MNVYIVLSDDNDDYDDDDDDDDDSGDDDFVLHLICSCFFQLVFNLFLQFFLLICLIKTEILSYPNYDYKGDKYCLLSE